MTNYTIASRVLASRAIVAFEGEATSSVQKIMANVVTETSGERYKGENITFLLWLFNDDTFRKELLHDWFYENMILAEKEDKERDKKKQCVPFVKMLLRVFVKVRQTVILFYLNSRSMCFLIIS